jgi:hypothetical protein
LPPESVNELYHRLIEIGSRVFTAIDEDAGAQDLMKLLADHKKAITRLKQIDTKADPSVLSIVQQARQQTDLIMQRLAQRRDDLAQRIMQSKSRKSAFDAYRKI